MDARIFGGAAVLLPVAACSGWFGPKDCEAGAQKCSGKRILTCTAELGGIATGEQHFSWQKTTSCALASTSIEMTCKEDDGFAACVPVALDGGASSAQGSSPTAAGTLFSSNPPLKKEPWIRFDVRRRGTTYEIGEPTTVDLDFAPAAPSTGAVAAVGYASGKAVGATLVSVSDDAEDAEATVWLPARGATRVALVEPQGRVVAERELSTSQNKTVGQSGLGAHFSGLNVALPSTLAIVNEGSAEMLDLVGQAFGRVPPTAQSVVSKLAFADGLAGGQRALVVGSTLVVNASPAAMTEYRKDPADLYLEVVRQLARQFMQMTSHKEGLGLVVPAFPSDYPRELAVLLMERVVPLLGPREGFADAWAGLHGIAVEGRLASQYTQLTSPPDETAIEMGFASGAGSQNAENDFVEFVARASVPERWPHSRCAELKSRPLERQSPKALVHLAKLEAAWGAGFLTTERLKLCAGSLALESRTPGITVFRVDDGPIVFGEDVSGSNDVYLHGESHISVTARGLDRQQAVFDIGFRGLPGLFRVSPVSTRPDPELGANVYIANPVDYQQVQMTGGLMLITRVDAERIEGHALMLRQGNQKGPPWAAATVFPLVTVRHDAEMAEEEER